MMHNSQESSIKESNALISSKQVRGILMRRLKKTSSDNPEQLVNQVDEDELAYQIEKTTNAISRELERKHRLQDLQEQNLKHRSLIKQQIDSKILASTEKKEKATKEMLDKKIKGRNFKEEAIRERKKELKETEFKNRIEKFKQYQSENKSDRQAELDANKDGDSENFKPRSHNSVSLIDLSLKEHLKKSKDLEEMKYSQKVQDLSKRGLFEKRQRLIQEHHTVDKSELIRVLREEQQRRTVQKVGEDLERIERNRAERSKSITKHLQSQKKQAEIQEQLRYGRVQELKQSNLQKLKARKELQQLKNERYLSVRNLSTPTLSRRKGLDNASTYSVSYLNGNGLQMNRGLSGVKSQRNASTTTNHVYRIALDEAKAADYLEKVRERKQKSMVRAQIENILKEKRKELLTT